MHRLMLPSSRWLRWPARGAMGIGRSELDPIEIDRIGRVEWLKRVDPLLAQHARCRCGHGMGRHGDG
jgi:hypothetical protein